MRAIATGLAAIATILAALLSPVAIAADATHSDLVQRGQYLATAGDCVACHTAPGGKPFAGGLPLDSPVGAIISTNITTSKLYGIGNYTKAQFIAALREGIRADEAHLYPAMPYAAYAKITDDDMLALYTWFMSAVAPVDAPVKPTELPFPFNIRASMVVWNIMFLDTSRFRPDPAKSADWNRGAYLARGLAHCGDCHTPRNLMMAEMASREFGGADIGTWYAPNITSDANSGVGGWSEQELADYMRTGHVAKAQAAGPMTEAIDNSLQYMTGADLRSIAVYLKSVPALHDASDTRPVTGWGAASNELPGIRGVASPDDPEQMSGAQLFDAYCSTCHQASGQGSFDGGLPRLFQTTAMGRSNTNNLVMVMLDGVQRRNDVSMPGFARELSDRQIATLGAYLIQHFGNPKATVTVEQVTTLRAGGAPSNLVMEVRVAMFAVVIVIGGGILMFAFRRRRKTVRVAP